MGVSPANIQDLLEDFEYGWGYWHYENDSPVAIGLDMDAETVSKIGGYEGDGEHVEVIVKVSGLDFPDRFFRKTGWWSSYGGSDWDGYFDEVFPKQKTVTVYEKG